MGRARVHSARPTLLHRGAPPTAPRVCDDPSRPHPQSDGCGKGLGGGACFIHTQITPGLGRPPPSPSEVGAVARAAGPLCGFLPVPPVGSTLEQGGPLQAWACPGDPTELPAPQDVPDPRLAALIPKGFETLGCTGLCAGPAGPSPPDSGAWEVGGEGLQGFGRGSRFSVRRGWEDELSEFPAREKGLLPNWRREGGDQGGAPQSSLLPGQPPARKGAGEQPVLPAGQLGPRTTD